MNQTERATILRLLSESSKALEDALAGVSKDDAARQLEAAWTVPPRWNWSWWFHAGLLVQPFFSRDKGLTGRA